MEFNKMIIPLKWLLLFLVITVFSYLSFYTTQPHHHISINSLILLPSLLSIDPGIAVISFITSILLTVIAYREFNKRSDKPQAEENK
jgi:hypothetical protein